MLRNLSISSNGSRLDTKSLQKILNFCLLFLFFLSRARFHICWSPMWGIRLRIHEREENEEKRQMNVYGITWSCVERQEVRLVKINHSHKFKTYAGASSEAIYWFWKPRDRLAAGPMILFIVESSCKINKEGKYTQKLSSVVASLPAPCESVESARARNKRRLSNHARGTRRARKKRSKWVTERLLSEGVH